MNRLLIIKERLSSRNWKNGMVRAWIVFMAFWTFAVLIKAVTNGLHTSTLLMFAWPFLLLFIIILVSKIFRWIFAGLHEKNDKIDKLIKDFEKISTFHYIIHTSKVFFRSSFFKIGALTIIFASLVMILLTPHLKSLEKSPSTSTKAENIPPPPPGFVLDRSADNTNN